MVFGEYFTVCMACFAIWALSQGASSSEPSSPLPTVVGPLHRGGAFLSLTHQQHAGNRIGYRFHEHMPYVFGQVPADSSGVDPSRTELLETEFSSPLRFYLTGDYPQLAYTGRTMRDEEPENMMKTEGKYANTQKKKSKR